MDWEIAAKKLPDLRDKARTVVGGALGGWFRPSDIFIADGRAYSVRNGRVAEIYAYLVLPEPPVKVNPSPPKKIVKKQSLRYPDNLISILERKYDWDGIEPITEEWLKEQLPIFCTERELKTIRMRFVNGDTLEECGWQLGISRERVRQIERKVVAKIYRRKFVETQIGNYGMPEDGNTKKCPSDKRETAIECLDLSVRAYNGLRRGGIDTVGQLTELSRNDIKAIRNIGSATVEEIEKKLSQFLEKGA